MLQMYRISFKYQHIIVSNKECFRSVDISCESRKDEEESMKGALCCGRLCKMQTVCTYELSGVFENCSKYKILFLIFKRRLVEFPVVIISQLLYYYTCGCDLEMNDFTLADLSKHCSSLFEEQLIIKSKGQGYLCMLCLEVKLIKDCS